MRRVRPRATPSMLIISRVLVWLLLLAASALAEQPGPDPEAFATQTYGAGIGLVYVCSQSYFVDGTTGNDSNPGSMAQPWKTIQHADAISRAPGDCINVAPGTYVWTAPFNQTQGGNAATPTGYVTYRCEVLDQCFISYQGPGGAGTWVWETVIPYMIIDGFDIDGGETFNYGGLADVCLVGSLLDTHAVGHHIWILNNVVHGCGLGGIDEQDSEYYFILHNTVTNSAWTSQFQGSGMCFCSLRALGDPLNPYPPYTPTQYDEAFAPFHNMMNWNFVYNNGCAVCLGIINTFTTSADTHGNTTLDNIGSVGTSASFTGVMSPGSQVITVSGSTGTISPGDQLFGAGTFQTTYFYPYGFMGTTGTGGDGTYFVSVIAPNGFNEAMTSSTLGEGLLVVGPGIQPFTYVAAVTGNSVTITRPALTTQSGGSFNFIAPGAGHTDGNGIIMDTWCGDPCAEDPPGGIAYGDATHQTLVSFNNSQFNGGRGLHQNGGNWVTFANNSTYHNGLDLYLAGALGEMSESGGVMNSWYNNAVFGARNLVTNCNFTGITCNFCVVAGDGRGTDIDTTFFNNVAGGGPGVGVGGTCVALFNADMTVPYWVPENNKGDTDPLFTDETSQTLGNLVPQFPQSPVINYAYPHAFYFLPKGTTDAGLYQTGGIRTTDFVGQFPDFPGSVGFSYLAPIPTPLSCSEATTFIALANMLADVDRVHTYGYQNLICGMVLDGTWCGTNYDAFWVTATVNAALAEVNMCNPGTYDLVQNGSPTFVPDRGFQGANQSSTIYLDTQFNPSTAVSPNFTQNSASIALWSLTNTLTDTNPAYAMGASPQLGFFSGIVALTPSEPTGNGHVVPYTQINNTNFQFAGPSLDTSAGFYMGTQTGGLLTGYVNGANAFNYTITPGTLATLCNIFILANNNCAGPSGTPHAANGSSLIVGFASLGNFMTSAQVASVCHRLNTYLTSIGAAAAGIC